MKNKFVLAVLLTLFLIPSIHGREKQMPEFPEMDSVVTAYMQKYGAPAVSVAVVKDERLVFVKSYGYQDVEKQIPATNENLYRIASISKPITVLGLLTLVKDGKLSLDDTVFGPKGILGEDFGPVPPGSNKDKITIKHLIEHKSGLQNIPRDAMFSYPELDQNGIVEKVVSERKLMTEPGAKYYYSNVGYCVLGRVIEKLSGQRYEDFIKERVLKPAGITDMRIGGNTLSQRYPNEVKYYDKGSNVYCYKWDITRMDSHGGWIASATDLAKLMVHIDRNPRVKDILPATLLAETYMGKTDWMHSGSLPGTATVMRRLDDEYIYVVLSNMRSGEKNFWNSLYNCGAIPIKMKKDPWPDNVDLFKKRK